MDKKILKLFEVNKIDSFNSTVIIQKENNESYSLECFSEIKQSYIVLHLLKEFLDEKIKAILNNSIYSFKSETINNQYRVKLIYSNINPKFLSKETTIIFSLFIPFFKNEQIKYEEVKNFLSNECNILLSELKNI